MSALANVRPASSRTFGGYFSVRIMSLKVVSVAISPWIGRFAGWSKRPIPNQHRIGVSYSKVLSFLEGSQKLSKRVSLDADTESLGARKLSDEQQPLRLQRRAGSGHYTSATSSGCTLSCARSQTKSRRSAALDMPTSAPPLRNVG